MKTMRLVLVFAVLAAVLPLNEAAKVKGLKGASSTTSGRSLKEKKGDGKLPKVKKAGPSSRTCKACEYFFICLAGSSQSPHRDLSHFLFLLSS